GGHGHDGHAGGADEGVDLAAGEDVHHVAAQEAADGGDCEGHQTQRHDLQGVQGQEPGGHSGGAYGDAQEHGDDIHQRILHRIAQALGDAALAPQVAQHQAADQGRGGGQEQDDEDAHHDGEDNLLRLGDFAGLFHLGHAHLLGGAQLHERGLNQGDQGHVGVGRDGDGAQELGSQAGGEEDGGGAVSAANDADGGGLVAGEAQDHSADVGHEHAQLGGGAQEQALGVGEQGAKIGHGADAHEDEGRVDACFDADVEYIQEAAIAHDGAEADLAGEEAIPQLRRIEAAAGKIGQQRAEGDAHQQQGLKLLDNAEIEKHAGDDDHHQVLPAIADKEVVKAGVIPEF